MLDLQGVREKVQYYRPVREKTHAQSLGHFAGTAIQ